MRFSTASVLAYTLVSVPTSTTYAQEIAGTYRLQICSSPCESADTPVSLAIADLVLFDSVGPLRNVADTLIAAIRDESWHMTRGEEPNACFSITRTDEEFKLLAGTMERGVTRWTRLEDGIIRISLYQSVDTAYILQGEITQGRYIGSATQHVNTMVWPRTYFYAERTGEATVAPCFSS